MKPTQPLAVHHSWPLFEQARHFDLGCLLNCAAIDAAPPAIVGQLGIQHAGCWECDLVDNELTWSGGVYDIFGFPRGAKIGRDDAAALYCEGSRTAMEKLRSYAIRHKRGFTLDAEIRPVTGGAPRWIRLITVPLCENGRPVRLHGVKLIIPS